MNLYNIDITTLTQQEQCQLFAFRDAWRPHTAIPTRAECKIMGEGAYFPDHGKALDEIKEQARMLDTMYYGFLETVTRDEYGNICDDEE